MTDTHRGDVSADGRRAEDRAVAENVTWLATTLDRFITWSKRVRWIVVLIGGTVVAIFTWINAYASWAGAQNSSPGQEISRVDGRVDLVDGRVDSVISALGGVQTSMHRMQIVQDSILRASDGKFDLLLRISCRGLEFRDLLAQCRAVGVPR